MKEFYSCRPTYEITRLINHLAMTDYILCWLKLKLLLNDMSKMCHAISGVYEQKLH